MNKVIRFLMPIVIAVVLGPLIAGLAVSLLAVATNISGYAGALPLAGLVKMSGVYIVFAYIMGGPIALLAGILVSLWTLRRPPNLIVVMTAAAFAALCYIAIGALGLLGPVEFTNARSNYLFTLVLAVIAAAGCWLLMRRFARPA